MRKFYFAISVSSGYYQQFTSKTAIVKVPSTDASHTRLSVLLLLKARHLKLLSKENIIPLFCLCRRVVLAITGELLLIGKTGKVSY